MKKLSSGELNMGMNFFKSVVLLHLLYFIPLIASAERIQKLRFVPGEDISRLEIQYSGKVNFQLEQTNLNSQIVLGADNASLAPELTKIIDISNQQSPVIQITPYNSGGKIPHAKFVLQLRQSARVFTKNMPGKFILEIKGDRIAKEKWQGNKLKPEPEMIVQKDNIKNILSANDKSSDIGAQLQKVLESPADQKIYFGKNVSFESSDASVHDVFRLVAETSGLNIITSAKVGDASKLNLSLRDIPWDQLLDIVLQQSGLRANIVGNVVRIATTDEFNADQDAKKKSIKLGLEMDPVIMAIIPLSYAKADEMKRLISDLLVKSTGSGAAAPSAAAAGSGTGVAASGGKDDELQAFVRGQIQIDNRSNSLIVTNTADAIDRMRRLVKELDVPLPQVLIDSKIVVADESFSKSLGVTYGMGTTEATGRAGAGFSFNGGAATMPTPLFAITQSTAQSASTPAGTVLGFQLGAGAHGSLNMQLQLAELKGFSKTIASPRVVVNNKQSAQVTDGIKIATVTPGSSSSPATTTYTSASLDLNVTPQITSAGSVLLDIDMKDDAPDGASGNITTKEVKTQVLIDSGSTLVLGGVYQYTSNKSTSGIPLLMDLPFLGSLFRAESESIKKEELMVFITPQILGLTNKM